VIVHSKNGLNFTGMEPDFKDLLAEYKDELTHFQSDDILVNIQPSKVLSTEEIQEIEHSKTQRMLKVSLTTYREIGVHPFCQSLGIVQWKKQEKTIETVVYLRDVRVDYRKMKAFQITEIDLDYFINPYFERWFRSTFNQDPPSFENRHELLAFFGSEAYTYLPDESYYGNFHPQRYELLKELEDLLSCQQFSQPIKRLLGHSDLTEQLPATWSLSGPYLFEFDPDQADVVEKLNHDSVTVQGPPGTGKSQVISNIIGTCLRQDKNVLVVSEKKSALQVIQQKLTERNLGFLCTHLSFHANSHAFYEDLKTTWERLSHVSLINEKHWIQFERSGQLAKQFQALKNADKELGYSFLEFQEKRPKKAQYSGFLNLPVPAYRTWLNDQKILNELSSSTLEILPFLSKSWLDLSTFQEQGHVLQNLIDCQSEYKDLFDLSNLESVQKSVKMAVVCHQFQGSIYEKYGRLLGKELSGLKREIKKWKEHNQAIELLDVENYHWKHEPSLAELHLLKSAAQEKGWIAGIRWTRLWKNWTRTPELNPIESIASKEKQLTLRADLKKRSHAFEAMGIATIELELPVIEQFIQHISMKDWTWYQALDSGERGSIARANRPLNEFVQGIKTLFTLHTEDHLEFILNKLSTTIDTLRSDFSPLQHLSDETFELLKSRKTITELDAFVHQHHWNTFVSKHPYMLDFELNGYKQEVKKELKRIQQEGVDLSDFLVEHQARKFADFHRLLSVPLSKLSEEEKSLRTRLRKGKSILVKEFAKTRNHLSIRELRSSEAKHWVDVLKPIQLSNPSSLASIFPMEKDQFDLVIFDESGQIPMSYALGALQRAKRVLVAGDHQQMSPSSYFRQSEELVIDLLHQSAYYLPNVLLTHHYRSRDARLIAFSNRYFYGGRLRTFAEKSINENHLKLTCVPNGEYSDGVNLMEAKVMAQLVEKALMSRDKYGVVAFSEAQLTTIQANMSPRAQQQLEEAIDKDHFFFKALEQVQGEECDHLLVGFGYGKNKEGKFDMRFGPINLKNGEKRLNVLFSRARKSIHFVTSVERSDFSSSKNEGVQRLKDWFVFIEEQSKLSAEKTDSSLSFQSLIEEEERFLSFINRYRILSQRNWELE
jgi:superfamily I DNA and/or RNA helicase